MYDVGKISASFFGVLTVLSSQLNIYLINTGDTEIKTFHLSKCILEL